MSSPPKPRRLETRHSGGEEVEPGGEAGVMGAPGAFEAQVEVAERASEGDRADVEVVRRRLIERAEGAGDLVALIGDPLLRAHFWLAPNCLVAQKHGRIRDSVRQRLLRQRAEAQLRVAWDDLAAAEPVEIFND